MKKSTIITFLFIGLLPTLSFSQEDCTGKYQAWFDICDRDSRHLSMTLEITNNDIHFVYLDDTQMRVANGKMKIKNDTILFEPVNKTDSIFIEGYFWNSTLWKKNETIIWTQHCPDRNRNCYFTKLEK